MREERKELEDAVEGRSCMAPAAGPSSCACNRAVTCRSCSDSCVLHPTVFSCPMHGAAAAEDTTAV